MKRYILVVLIVLWGSFSAFSQEINDSTATSRVYAIEKTSLGIGAGFNYGDFSELIFYFIHSKISDYLQELVMPLLMSVTMSVQKSE